MECLHEKVTAILRQHYADLQDGLEVVEETGRVLGSVMSSAFRGLDHEERQRQVWTHLEAGFTPDELRLIGPIVTLTPAEAQIDVGIDG